MIFNDCAENTNSERIYNKSSIQTCRNLQVITGQFKCCKWT